LDKRLWANPPGNAPRIVLGAIDVAPGFLMAWREPISNYYCVRFISRLCIRKAAGSSQGRRAVE
jgi:hypothetical protein